MTVSTLINKYKDTKNNRDILIFIKLFLVLLLKFYNIRNYIV